MNRSVSSFAPATNVNSINYGSRCSSQFLSVNKNDNRLSSDNIHKMIGRFLNEKRMSKKELAGMLEITVRSLEQLFSNDIPYSLLARVNLPLARLYCGTKW